LALPAFFLIAMTNEQATELLALMADQIKATDRLSETFERRFTQLNETMLNGFVRLEDKFDKKTDILAEEIQGTNRRVDTLTDEVREMKAEAQTTNRRLQATFEHAGFLTEENTTKETRLVQLETSSADMQLRIQKLEEQLRRAS
jgi:uncharacterized protein YoxC